MRFRSNTSALALASSKPTCEGHLIAVQNEPAVLVYGAIAFFSGWFCPPNLHRKMEEMGDRPQGTKKAHSILRREFAAFSTFGIPLRVVPAVVPIEVVR